MKINTPQICKAKPIATQDLDHMSRHRKKNGAYGKPYVVISALYAVLLSLYAVISALYAVLRTLYAVILTLYAVLWALYAVNIFVHLTYPFGWLGANCWPRGSWTGARSGTWNQVKIQPGGILN